MFMHFIGNYCIKASLPERILIDLLHIPLVYNIRLRGPDPSNMLK